MAVRAVGGRIRYAICLVLENMIGAGGICPLYLGLVVLPSVPLELPWQLKQNHLRVYGLLRSAGQYWADVGRTAHVAGGGEGGGCHGAHALGAVRVVAGDCRRS